MYLTNVVRAAFDDAEIMIKRYRIPDYAVDVLECWRGPWFTAEAITDVERRDSEDSGIALDRDIAITIAGRLIYAEQSGR